MSNCNCPLCKNHTTQRLFNSTDRTGMTNAIFTVMRCCKCGLFFLIPRPEPYELLALYPQKYEPFRAPFDELNWFWHWTYKRHWAIRSQALQDACPEGGQVLDIGCATGLFLHRLCQNDLWQPIGLDISESALTVARHQGLSVLRGRASRLCVPDDAFDIVTIWEVIEHVLDPAYLLSEIHRVLKPNGILLLSTPNGQSLQACFWRDNWFGWEVPRHVQIFSPSTLRWALGKTGFELVRTLHFPTDKFYFEESFRRWLESRDHTTTARWVPALVALLIWPISKIVDYTPRSSSLVVEARSLP